MSRTEDQEAAEMDTQAQGSTAAADAQDTAGQNGDPEATAAEAAENLGHFERLQRQLSTNVQEALAVEIGLLKLRL